MQERFERRNTSALEDMAAPLQITVGPATRGETDIWWCKCLMHRMVWKEKPLYAFVPVL